MCLAEKWLHYRKWYIYMVEHCIAVQRGELGRDQLASSQKISLKGQKQVVA